MTAAAAPRRAERLPVVDMRDLSPYASALRVTSARVEAETVVVAWDDGGDGGGTGRFHRLWLRDNCACPACRHPLTLERTFELLDLPGEPKVESADVTAAGALRVVWAPMPGVEPHVSLFDPGWLAARVGSAPPSARPARRTWGADLDELLPEITYEEVAASNAGLYRWLETLEVFGAVRLRGLPCEDGMVRRFAERIGPIRETNFGTVFDVVSKPNPNNAAYTAIKLEPHADLVNWKRAPDIQLLHCHLNESTGGESILVDGLGAADALRRDDPAAFRLLASEPIDFRFQDADCDIRYRGPIIETDADGRVVGLRFNNWIRDTGGMDADRAGDIYRAYLALWRLLRDPTRQARFRLGAGDLIAFDNLRTLHGRAAFDPNTGARKLQGCYLDRDHVENQMRMIERRMATGTV
jgi:gamma-butyrobetaine dioxygenase